MGHVDIIGTETYLHTTPELLALAGNRLRRRYKSADEETTIYEPLKLRVTPWIDRKLLSELLTAYARSKRAYCTSLP